MIFKTFVVGPLEVNCYILGCERSGEGIVIDPGDDAPEVLEALKDAQLSLKYILNTHGHFDHIGGVKRIKEATGAPFLLHEADLFLVEALTEQAMMFGMEPQESPEVDGFLNDGDEVDFGSYRVLVVHTPGHSPGGVCFHMGDKLFSGDTLFAGSIGRTDLMGGSYEGLIRSVRTRILPLGDEVRVYPGHGPETTIGWEQLYNPFLRDT